MIMACDHPPAIIHVVDDMGGAVAQYLARAGLARACGDEVRISGGCYSACTIFLSVPRACAQRNASFGFHAAYYRGRQGAPPDDLVRAATRAMLEAYPAPVRAALGNHLTVGMRHLSGAALIRMGAITPC